MAVHVMTVGQQHKIRLPDQSMRKGPVQIVIGDRAIVSAVNNNDGTMTITGLAVGSTTITVTVFGGATEGHSIQVLESKEPMVKGEAKPVRQEDYTNSYKGPPTTEPVTEQSALASGAAPTPIPPLDQPPIQPRPEVEKPEPA